MGAVELSRISVNEEVVSILADSVKMVLETTFGLSLDLKEQRMSPSPIATGDISGVIGIFQAHQEGNMILSFPKETLFYALEKVYGTQMTELNEVVTGAAGELTNMVYGQFKKEMNAKGFALQMALPTIVSSQNHQISQVAKIKGCFLSFKIGGQYSFSLTLTINGD